MATEAFTLILNLGSITALILTGVGYIRRDAQKQRDEERDYSHLKNSYKQLVENLKIVSDAAEQTTVETLKNQEILREIDREVESLNRTLIAQKAAIENIAARVDYVAARMDGGYGRTPH